LTHDLSAIPQLLTNMLADARTFYRFGLLSIAGFAFYYAHIFFGMVSNGFMFKAIAVGFLLATVPLPIIAMNNKKLFPALAKRTSTFLALGTLLLLVHHFLMTFIFVMFLPEGAVF
jgi:hypothetical protein